MNINKDTLELLDNLQQQIKLQQQQIDILSNEVFRKEKAEAEAKKQGLENLHKEAGMKLPEGASKTGEGEDEHGED